MQSYTFHDVTGSRGGYRRPRFLVPNYVSLKYVRKDENLNIHNKNKFDDTEVEGDGVS